MGRLDIDLRENQNTFNLSHISSINIVITGSRMVESGQTIQLVRSIVEDTTSENKEILLPSNSEFLTGMVDDLGNVSLTNIQLPGFGCPLKNCMLTTLGGEAAFPFVAINWNGGEIITINNMGEIITSEDIDNPDLRTDVVVYPVTSENFQERILNSFQITEAPFGIPDYLPIGFLGLVVGVDLLKKGRSKKKESAEKDEQP